ncbi:MAG: hypothetical protein RJA24_723, partial [Pseudomonadota bacterium]
DVDVFHDIPVSKITPITLGMRPAERRVEV